MNSFHKAVSLMNKDLPTPHSLSSMLLLESTDIASNTRDKDSDSKEETWFFGGGFWTFELF